MTLSLYDAVIPSNLQILGALRTLIDKAAAFADERGVAAADAIDWRLAPDMLPFGYQVKSCAVHSVGAIAGVRAGSFSPDRSAWPDDFAALGDTIDAAEATLRALDAAEVEALAHAPVVFRLGENAMPFTGAQFLLSFAQPNFYFHATTAYAILRAQGMPLGKRDFLGRLRMER